MSYGFIIPGWPLAVRRIDHGADDSPRRPVTEKPKNATPPSIYPVLCSLPLACSREAPLVCSSLVLKRSLIHKVGWSDKAAVTWRTPEARLRVSAGRLRPRDIPTEAVAGRATLSWSRDHSCTTPCSSGRACEVGAEPEMPDMLDPSQRVDHFVGVYPRPIRGRETNQYADAANHRRSEHD